MNNFTEVSLAELLSYCCDPRSKSYQPAWEEFYRRYGAFVYSTVKNRLLQSKYSQDASLTDMADDVVEKVYGTLIKDDFATLKTFRFPDDEAKFKAFLKIICSKATNTFFHR